MMESVTNEHSRAARDDERKKIRRAWGRVRRTPSFENPQRMGQPHVKTEGWENRKPKVGQPPEPDQWRWSSFRAYGYGETGIVRVNDAEILKVKVRAI
jgi:hypothetical protein